MPAEEQAFERELADLVQRSLAAGDEPEDAELPTADDVVGQLCTLRGILGNLGTDADSLLSTVTASPEYDVIGEIAVEGIQGFIQFWGTQHSTLGDHRAETFELFDLTATIYVMCARLEAIGKAAGVLAFLWDVAICTHFRLFSNPRESQTQLLVQRREIDRVLKAAAEGGDIDDAIIRLRRHLFARARMSAIRGCAQ